MHYRSLLLAASAVVISAQGVPNNAYAQDANPFQSVSAVEIVYTGAPIIPASAATSSEVEVYVVMMKDEPVASYRGNREGFEAVPRGRGNRPDVRSENARNYRAHLRGKQQAFVRSSTETLSRSPQVVHTYTEVLNGVAVRISGQEARALAKDPSVAAIIRSENHAPSTYAGPTWIGAAEVWNGPAGLQTEGEGMVVGIIDTGVNWASPSFAATDPTDGYVHTNPYGSGNFVGVCDASHPLHQPDYVCNDKLVGAYYFLNAWGTFPNLGAFDENGHGSHVASTSAGNKVTINYNGANVNLSGVAPRANVISYRVCGGPSTLCNTADSAAAIDQAIFDGVDALNFSIGGGTNPGGDLASLAFLRAADAGIFVAAAAGNFNPNSAGTVSHRGGWMTTVASVSHNGIVAHPVSVTGPAPIAGAPLNLGGVAGTSPVPVTDIGFTTVGIGSQGKGRGQLHGQGEDLNAGKVEYRWAEAVSPGNFEGCAPFPAGAFDGAIALISRGTCGFALKADNAAAAGAVAAVIYNNANGPPIVMGAQQANTIPSVMVSNLHGQMLVDWASSHSVAYMSIGGTPQASFSDGNGDIVVLSSGRGPSGNILKPDVAAPGASVLAAYTPNPDSYVMIGGTSMASPHVAGAALLVSALHPDWSPLEVKSALMTTGRIDGVLQPDATTQATPFYIGGGRVRVDQAARAGLVLHETRANFEAGNAGGNLANLNLASFANQNCNGTCSWTRTLRSTGSVGTNWAVTTSSSAAGLSVSAPASFSVAAGGTVSL
ncbi:MAG: S8 family serine peptidase, partial [Gammaproteobacteria bacterium]